MDRRAFITTMGSGLLAAPLAMEAQQAGKVSRIGYLSPFSPASEPVRPSFEAFHQGLRELGWILGQNVSHRVPLGREKYDRLPALAAELVRLNVDVIVAASLPAAFATKRATTTIPIVFVGFGDPVSTGLVGGLARPGGNVTGLAGLALELSGKRLGLRREGDARTAPRPEGATHRLWHPWLRINRVLRVMLHTRWSAEAWPGKPCGRRTPLSGCTKNFAAA
jgi:putative ABC transport system substrate-binding protein